MKLKELKELIECCNQNNVSHLKDAEVELSFHVNANSPPQVVVQESTQELTQEDLAKKKQEENDMLMFMSS